MINVNSSFIGKNYFLQVKPEDNIKTLIEKVKIMADYRNIRKLSYSGRYYKSSGKFYVRIISKKVDDENIKISEFNNIDNSVWINVFDPKDIIGAGPIGNLDNENAENLGFDLN